MSVSLVRCDAHEHVFVELHDFLLILSQMTHTEEWAALNRGPAALLIASRVFLDYGALVLLPEVKRLSRVDLISDTRDEVLVGNLTITIFVEEFEDDILLLGLQWEAPMLQEKD